MAANLAEDIKQAEENAKRIKNEAKAEAALLVAEARSARETRTKEARKDLHQLFRQETSKAEAEAENRAKAILEEGKKETEAFVQARKDRVGEVASWLVEEVTAKYGLN